MNEINEFEEERNIDDQPPMRYFWITGNVVGETPQQATRDVPIHSMLQVARDQETAIKLAFSWATTNYDLSNARWINRPVVKGGF